MKFPVLHGSIAAVLALGSVSTFAQDTWTGTVDANWSTAGNWFDTTEPSATDAVTFPLVIPASGGTITLSAGELADSVTFANSYTLTGGGLTLTAGTITVDPTFTATINS